jgi:Kef-type K+ transport system membrane component KefB
MIAGIILGPSILGAFAPDLQQAIFPKNSNDILYLGAQLGVGLYMFLVGLSFQGRQFASHARSAAAVSIAGMAAPFIAAVLVSPWLYGFPGLFGGETTLFQATLFMGAAISITAFPVLARIIEERGLSGSALGALALSAGAIADAFAWSVLAVVLATLGEGPGVAAKAIAGCLGFTIFMLTLGPRLLAPLGALAEREGRVGHGLLAVVLMLFMLCALAMDAIGIHAVFGGFILGTVLPRGVLADDVKRQLEPFVVVALIPLFFTFSGLHTQLTMIDSVELLLVTVVILVGSMLAKGGACWAAAKLSGQDNPTALAIGALMNTRGLMELILANIGLQRGVIGPALFSMLVLMAIITTLMASPLLDLVYGRRLRAQGEFGKLRGTEAPAQATAAVDAKASSRP